MEIRYSHNADSQVEESPFDQTREAPEYVWISNDPERMARLNAYVDMYAEGKEAEALAGAKALLNECYYFEDLERTRAGERFLEFDIEGGKTFLCFESKRVPTESLKTSNDEYLKYFQKMNLWGWLRLKDLDITWAEHIYRFIISGLHTDKRHEKFLAIDDRRHEFMSLETFAKRRHLLEKDPSFFTDPYEAKLYKEGLKAYETLLERNIACQKKRFSPKGWKVYTPFMVNLPEGERLVARPGERVYMREFGMWFDDERTSVMYKVEFENGSVAWVRSVDLTYMFHKDYGDDASRDFGNLVLMMPRVRTRAKTFDEIFDVPVTTASSSSEETSKEAVSDSNDSSYGEEFGSW